MSASQQDPGQGSREGKLAHGEGDAEVDGTEQRGDGGARGEGEQEKEQLAAHAGESLGGTLAAAARLPLARLVPC
jgi:hypothetical protein